MLYIKVCTRSSKKGFGETVEYNGRNYIKLYVQASPVENQANDEVIQFLSKNYKIAKSKIKIVSGEKSQYKSILIDV